MKKLLMCMGFYFLLGIPYKVVSADQVSPVVYKKQVEAYIDAIYKQIDFTHCTRLSFDVFSKAYTGYLNLRNDNKLNADKEIISICDFNLPSSANRLWVIDLVSCKVMYNTYVAHGQGSGEDFAENFSNTENSHQSSLGFYVTGDTYNGDHGVSLRLNGLDLGFNDAALERGIVMHGADYVCSKYISENQRLGRSWGCPAINNDLKKPIIDAIEGGTCLFIYRDDNKYIKSAYWVNKKIDHIPGNGIYASFVLPVQKTKAKKIVYEYVHNNTIDSIITAPVSSSK